MHEFLRSTPIAIHPLCSDHQCVVPEPQDCWPTRYSICQASTVRPRVMSWEGPPGSLSTLEATHPVKNVLFRHTEPNFVRMTAWNGLWCPFII